MPVGLARTRIALFTRASSAVGLARAIYSLPQ